MFSCASYRESKVLQVQKVKMVQMAHPESLEMMVPPEIQVLKDHKVTKADLQLSKIVPDAHQVLPRRVSKVVPVNQEIPANPAILVQWDLAVNLVDAFLVIKEIPEQMVSQVMMEQMVRLVIQVHLEILVIMFALRNLLVAILSLV